MAILITGGAGYIGSHTCVEMLEAGYEIVVLDNFSNSQPESIRRISEITGKGFAFYEADLLDEQRLNRIFEQHRIDAVIHFAGLKAVGESVHVPLEYYHTNLTSTLVLCRAMAKHGVYKLVFSSSASVYGVPECVPISEEASLGAVSPYGRTKQMIEQVLQDLASSDPRWGISILRYFNPVGAHKSGKIGESPNGMPNNLMPFITQVAVGRLPSLKVYGCDYPTKDGTGIRDYIHVVDLAQIHLKALEHLDHTNGVEFYNLGTGRGFTVLEMIHSFEKVSGIRIPYEIVGRRPGDVAICYADPTKSHMNLGWFPKYGIIDMCEDSWNWQIHNPQGYCERITAG
ncbi:UDP-glucose 4-epimerase GalE [Paenibacillus melissococcoides]|uniref:UDP-glucose 4-epimerase n=1 Tax=Paenibacillus melissococcoides TaxID=2912268 RepID=A0ABM9FZS9_9BACL|nr:MULTISPECIES: UDP-glucose 4-epimerase GalE [Paenibacillus]MEB9893586.1 UDP-glucose 4-epimerase GalE [Bacillus cereus]CAH8244808.1 UDP-glucose 4-epimerase GalE [Paenibacillus melissococcoides]CAH8709036.1 UDP-glucose 4-epimerase GalE [Paenibacillus melissococcoides]CAH8709791.1 UDP-glucose 4-epimerase GalE [Paenibacillus melissococcoides]GIO80625.1 UDP-glucose 4-epimerase [Paenibacillus dendritiformis]